MKNKILNEISGSDDQKLQQAIWEEYKQHGGPLKVDNPETLSRIMRNINITPYMFLKFAYIEISQGNFIMASKWIEYSVQFEGKYFENHREEETFTIINRMAIEYFELMSKRHQGGIYDKQ